jgi:hypothetical protein
VVFQCVSYFLFIEQKTYRGRNASSRGYGRCLGAKLSKAFSFSLIQLTVVGILVGVVVVVV